MNEEGVVTECLEFYLNRDKEETQFSYGTGCWAHRPAFCPGPDRAYENLNYENTMWEIWEATCTNK